MRKYKLQLLWLVPAMMMAACSNGFDAMDEIADDAAGTATFQLLPRGHYGLAVTSRAGETEEDTPSDETESPDETATAPEGISALRYVLADKDGNIIEHHHAILENDFSRLRLEGLQNGKYSIMFLATAEETEGVSYESPAAIPDAWLVNEKESSPVHSTHYYKKLDFSIGFDHAPVNERVELVPAVAKIDVVLKMMNQSLWRNIQNVAISFDGDMPTSMNADGSYSGHHRVRDYNLTESAGMYSFTAFPAEKPVSGYVEIVSSVDGGENFTTRYPFKGLRLKNGMVSRIEVAYRHPDNEKGRMYLRKDDLWRFDTDTMFMSDEPRTVFYNNSLRSFYPNAPLQFSIASTGALSVKLYSPIPVKNVRLLARLCNVSNEWFDLAYFDEIPPFLEGKFDLPMVSRECFYTTTTGRNIRIPAQPSLKPTDIEFRIETDDEFMKKIATIKSNWYIRFSKYSADNASPGNWRHMNPMLCRHGVALALNMAFMFDSQEFSDELDTYDGILFDNGKNLIDLNALRNKIKNHGGLNLGCVGGVGGLGGGQTYGLADYCYTGVYHDATAPNSNPHNYARQAMFHEYGHCLGYNHTSNMTYGDKWTVLCAKVFVQLGKEGKLPVPNRTDVTNLPYNR